VWTDLEAESGIAQAAMELVARRYATAERVIACWAMGLTQHKHGVGNVQEVTNLLLLRGNLGRPGAGLCPVRGHSNVQGDRTMGIWERPTASFLDRLGREFGFTPPAHHGHDTVDAIGAMAAGTATVFIGLGGNFAAAAPDTERTRAALARCQLTVQISTTLNRSHVATGREALILPCLGRTEFDRQAGGPQSVTVEDSMSVVHRSTGHLPPASAHLRSEPAIVAMIAAATLAPQSRIDWAGLVADYDRIRDHIARVIPGFEDFNRRVRTPDGFVLPNGARDRRFTTPSGKAHFSVVPLPTTRLPAGQWRLMTVRSHDQFNTTIYGLDDRYRGVIGDRRVLFLHPDDLRAAGLAAGMRVDLTSHFDGTTRTVHDFRLVPYEVPRGCAATYFPEANPLVPLESFADQSRTPTYKSIPITITVRS
jgi:molybdopterin-dependent oxidoreductase alpha subunit